MNLKQSFNMAIQSIKSNKLRAFLTLLGIIVGVFSIIGVMTAMKSLQNSIETVLSQLGSNTFQIQKFPAIQFGHGLQAKYRNRKNITYEDGLIFQERILCAKLVGFEAYEWGKVIKSTSYETNPNINIFGESEFAAEANNWIISEGRSLNKDDILQARYVAVLGISVAEKLFPFDSPIGKDIKLDGYNFKVIGLYESKETLFGGFQDNFVAIPLTTFFNVYGNPKRTINILVMANDQSAYDDCIEEATGILRTIRKVPPGGSNDFEIFSNDTLIRQFNELTFYVRIGIIIISFIALVSAGVGIMNIMLVSVTERTREIGIRKALGAKNKNILVQFLVEAVILCQIGGLIGIILGLIGGNFVSLMLNISITIPIDWILIGILVCVSVGIIFGVYPAMKAARLNPIEALRHE